MSSCADLTVLYIPVLLTEKETIKRCGGKCIGSILLSGFRIPYSMDKITTTHINRYRSKQIVYVNDTSAIIITFMLFSNLRDLIIIR